MPVDWRVTGRVNTDFPSLTQFLAEGEKRAQLREIAKQRVEQAKADQAFQSILASAPDEETAIAQLRRQGFLDPADKLEKSLYDRRDRVAKALKDDHEREGQMYTTAASILTAARNNPSMYPQARQILTERIGREPGGSAFLAHLPETYDPATTPQMIDLLVNSTTAAGEQEKKKLESWKLLFGSDPRAGVLGYVSTTQNQSDLDHLNTILDEYAAPKELRALVPKTWSKEVAQQAADRALTVDQRMDNQLALEAAQASAANTAADNARADAAAKRAEANEAARIGIDRARLGLESRRVDIAAQAEKRAATTGTGTDGSGVKLSVAQQTDLADMLTLKDMASKANAIGEEIKWAGVGGMGSGTVNQFFARNFGKGTEREQDLRNEISNITATIAKLRGGTAFTPNEQKLLEQYTPTIDDNKLVIKSKLKSLVDFIETKRKNLINVVSGNVGGGGGQTTPAQTYTVGQVVTIKGQPHKITKVYANGSFDADPVKK